MPGKAKDGVVVKVLKVGCSAAPPSHRYLRKRQYGPGNDECVPMQPAR
jgi:hypothetical protein